MPLPVDENHDRINKLFNRIVNNLDPNNAALQQTHQEFGDLLEELEQADSALQAHYDELLKLQQDIEDQRRRFQDFFDHAPYAYLVTDAHGGVINANQAAGELLGIRADFLVSKPINLYFSSENYAHIFQVLSEKNLSVEFEALTKPRSGSAADVLVKVDAVPGAPHEALTYRWMLHDISESKRRQAELEASEERFRTIFHGAHIGMCLVAPDGSIADCNPAMLEMVGYALDELHEKPLLTLIHAEDRAWMAETVLDLFAMRDQSRKAELRIIHKNEQPIWVRTTTSLLCGPNKMPQYLVLTVENIQTEKLAAHDLAEQKHMLIDSIEMERTQLARDLHDGPMQDLYSVVFKLNLLLPTQTGSALTDEIKETEEIIKNVAATLRLICGELRPPTLMNLGVERAIRSHAGRIQDSHPGLKIQLYFEKEDHPLPPKTAIALFRIYQQAINNVLLHSGADLLGISLFLQEPEIRLIVEDNGKGFTVPEKWVEIMRQGHFGLAEISERAEALGGELSISSIPGKGTRLEVMVPSGG